MLIESVINLLFLFEMIVDLVSHKSIKKAYSRQFRLWPETICQILNIQAIIYFAINY